MEISDGLYLAVVRFGERYEKLLLLMFQNQLHEGVELTVRKDYLALAVDDIFLEIEGYRLGIAEILHGFGHGNARLLAYPEKTVYGSAIREYHGSVFEYLYPRNSLRLTPTTLIKGR